jgi:hypothetical protein
LDARYSGREPYPYPLPDVDDIYEDTPDLQDAKEEIRSGGYDTGLPSEWSRHYESKTLADKLPDGSWVAWTYWYGGGKYSNPEEVPWMHTAFDVDCTIEMIPVNIFTKPLV